MELIARGDGAVPAPSDKSATFREYLSAARYRRPTLLVTLAAGLLITVLLAVLLPAHWRSAGTILIEQQEMPQDLVRSTVTSYADERVQVISKRVMTTETLLNIINRYNLYPQERAKDTREALLTRMRKDIGLKMISADVIDPRSGHPTTATIAFEVSYTSKSPDQAAKVANELTTLYLNENLSTRAQLARDAATFLEGEGDRLNQQMVGLEAQLEKFKEKNFKMLPEVTQLNMTMLDRTEEELRTQDSRRTALEQQRVFLEAQLAQLKPNSAMYSDSGERIMSTADRLKMLKSQLAAARARYAPDHPDIASLQRQVDGLEAADGAHPPGTASESQSRTVNDLRRELESTQAELALAREKYGPEHPDRLRLEREVESLQTQLAAVPPPPAELGSMVPHLDADNPAYVQIQAQLAATVNDLQALEGETSKLRAKVSQLQSDITLAPQVEQQYRELTRDLDNTRLKYQELRSKQTEAKVAQNLEADRKGERFTLIDPPLPPEEPISPNRKLIAVAGLVLTVALMAGVLWLLETLDTSVKNRMDLLKLTGVPPLALVPRIVTDSEYRAAGRRRLIALAGGAAAICIAVALTHFFYRPLDVLWFTMARRMGL